MSDETCGAVGEIRFDGEVIDRPVCTKAAGHDGPDHGSDFASWGDEALPHPAAADGA